MQDPQSDTYFRNRPQEQTEEAAQGGGMRKEVQGDRHLQGRNKLTKADCWRQGHGGADGHQANHVPEKGVTKYMS